MSGQEERVRRLDRVISLVQRIDAPQTQHAVFARYGLGEPWSVAVHVGIANRATPLTADAMRLIAAGWSAASAKEGDRG